MDNGSVKHTFFLGVDIGNTHTVIGLFKGVELLRTWRIRTRKDATEDELWALLSQLIREENLIGERIEDIVICCVVPPLVDPWTRLSVAHFGHEPLVINSRTPLDIKIKYERPYELGADRIANAMAAFRRYKKAVIVVDYGTAITFDCISTHGEYLGGAIAPGIQLSAEALFKGTSRLPRVDLSREPGAVIAQDTASAIQVGLLYGFSGLTDRIVRALAEQFDDRPEVIATGGLSSVIVPYCETVKKIIPNLTLEGIAEIYKQLTFTQSAAPRH